MVNGGVLEVARGGSGFRGLSWSVADPQGLGGPKCDLDGRISPRVHATNRWCWTEEVGEVLGLSLSPAFLASAPTGSRAGSYSE